MTNPYRIPDEQVIPEPLDFAYAVFSTDLRVMNWARTKFEVPDEDKEDNVILRRAVLRLWHMAKQYGQEWRADHRTCGPNASPDRKLLVGWYNEALTLSERVGKSWQETPIPTLVEALSDDEMLHPLGFPETRIQSREHKVIMTHPQVVVRARRLVLGPDYVCDSLRIEDIRIGRNSMMCNGSPIPGVCFSAYSFPFRLDMETCQVSQSMSLYLENTSSSPVEVNAVMFCVVRRGDW